MKPSPSLPFRGGEGSLPRPALAQRGGGALAAVAILLLAAFLHFWRLEREGFANLYYAAAVRSMLTSPGAFFFVSFDAGGFVSVDKPPLGLWMQAFSALLFGFHGWSLLWPQAVAGVLSVAMLYRLVGRAFGPIAGLIAALVLALTPINVAADRNNTMDSQLLLTSLLAAWAATLAVERGKLRWLLLAGVLIGVGFNIKMLQAYLVLPAICLFYLVGPAVQTKWRKPLAGDQPWRKPAACVTEQAPGGQVRLICTRLAHLVAMLAVVAAVSLSWAAVVDLTPPAGRPFVGSSRDNTVRELILGHNGAARLGVIARWIGWRSSAPGPAVAANPAPSGTRANPAPGNPSPAPLGGTPGNPLPPPGGPAQPQPAPAPAGPNNEIGLPGPLRLFNAQLVGQASWLLPLTIPCLLAAAWHARRLRWPLRRHHAALLLWAAWLAPQVIFFSFAGLFHRYYLEMLSPAIAALVGAGAAALWDDYRRPGWRGWLLSVVLWLGAAAQVALLAHFPEWRLRLAAPIAILCGVAGVVLIAWRWQSTLDKTADETPHVPGTFRKCRARGGAVPAICAAGGLLALLIAPAAWSVMPVLAGGDAALPYAGPDLLRRPRQGPVRPPDVGPLVAYLTASRRDERWLVATASAQTASPVILATGQPVMALGGFSGNDRILSIEALAARVATGEVRFFLLPAPQVLGQSAAAAIGPPPNGRNTATELARWVAQRCTARPANATAAGPRGCGVASGVWRAERALRLRRVAPVNETKPFPLSSM